MAPRGFSNSPVAARPSEFRCRFDGKKEKLSAFSAAQIAKWQKLKAKDPSLSPDEAGLVCTRHSAGQQRLIRCAGTCNEFKDPVHFSKNQRNIQDPMCIECTEHYGRFDGDEIPDLPPGTYVPGQQLHHTDNTVLDGPAEDDDARSVSELSYSYVPRDLSTYETGYDEGTSVAHSMTRSVVPSIGGRTTIEDKSWRDVDELKPTFPLSSHSLQSFNKLSMDDSESVVESLKARDSQFRRSHGSALGSITEDSTLGEDMSSARQFHGSGETMDNEPHGWTTVSSNNRQQNFDLGAPKYSYPTRKRYDGTASAAPSATDSSGPASLGTNTHASIYHSGLHSSFISATDTASMTLGSTLAAGNAGPPREIRERTRSRVTESRWAKTDSRKKFDSYNSPATVAYKHGAVVPESHWDAYSDEEDEM